jgi:hypothetical protein
MIEGEQKFKYICDKFTDSLRWITDSSEFKLELVETENLVRDISEKLINLKGGWRGGFVCFMAYRPLAPKGANCMFYGLPAAGPKRGQLHV